MNKKLTNYQKNKEQILIRKKENIKLSRKKIKTIRPWFVDKNLKKELKKKW